VVQSAVSATVRTLERETTHRVQHTSAGWLAHQVDRPVDMSGLCPVLGRVRQAAV